MSYQSWNTSSAYKLNIPDYKEMPKTAHKKPDLKRRKNKKAVFVRKVKRLAMIATVLTLAFMIVRGYVALDEMSGSITSLKKEYNSIVAENQAIQAEIDKSLDLEELQRIATEEYGMIRPERYQIFYVDMGLGDAGTVVADNENGKDEPSLAGASGMLVDSMNIFD